MPKQRTTRSATAARRGARTTGARKDITAPTTRRKTAAQTTPSREARRKRTTRAKGVSPESTPPTPRPVHATPQHPSKSARRTISEPPNLQHPRQETSHHDFLTKWLQDAQDASDSYEHVGALFDGYTARLGDPLAVDENDTSRAAYTDILSQAKQVVNTTYEAVRGVTFESVPFQDQKLSDLERSIEDCQARVGDVESQTGAESSKTNNQPSRAATMQSGQTTQGPVFRPQDITNCRWRECSFASNLYRLKTHTLHGHASEEDDQGNYICLWEDGDLCGKQFLTSYAMKEHVWLSHLDYDDSMVEDDGAMASDSMASDEVKQVISSTPQENFEQSTGTLDIMKNSIYGALSYISPFKARLATPTNSRKDTTMSETQPAEPA